MSLTQHTTKIMGWAYEATEGVSPIINGTVPYYEFGQGVKTRGNFPIKEYALHAYYAGSRDPNLKVSHILPKGAMAIAPTNGVEFYNIFGSSSTVGGVHTLSGINSGSLPTRVLRYQSENATENIREELLGIKTKALNFELFNVNSGMRMPAMMGIGMQGINISDAVYDADYDPVFPDSKDKMYYVDSNFEFTWDYGVDNIDYSKELIDFQYICDLTNRFQPLINQINPNTILDGNRTHIVSFKILRGGDTSIYDDFVAQTRSSVGKPLRVKIFNSATEYIQLDINGIFMDKNTMNDANDQSNENDFYQVSALATDVVPKILDGLTPATFYGE